MTRYANGQAPLSDLIYLGPEFYLPAGTAARWRELQRLAWEKYGVWLVPTPGWNGYRPLDIQYEYRAELGIWAAVPGYSSHGLTFNGRDCAAIDVNNWGSLAPGNSSLAWARFVALCRIVGFTVDFVKPQELWHIGDFEPFTVPAFAAIKINPIPVPEDDMYDKEAEQRLMKRLDKLERAAAPFKVVSWGTGLIAINPLNGKFWILPGGYAELLGALGFVGGDAFAVDDAQLTFATAILPNLIGIGGDDRELTDADMAEIRAIVQESRVVVTTEQLEQLKTEVAKGAREGGEAGAAAVLDKLTVVISAAG